MNVIENWDRDKSFWVVNSFFKTIDCFYKLFKEDKSWGKKDSSQLMWALCYLCDFSSKFRKLPEKERKVLISNDILKNPKFNWEDKKIKEYIKQWEVFKTPMQKQMSHWEKFLNQKNELMDDLKMEISNYKTIQDMLLSNVELQEAYDSINEKLAQESDGGKIIGGGRESLLEKEEL